jgi:hypothetical protein
VIVWGGALWDGGQYDPALDRWSSVEKRGAPSPLGGFALVWTGHEAVLWGTSGASGRYDPLARRWAVMNAVPPSREGAAVVWTGNEMILWSGWKPFMPGQYMVDSSGSGERYDPATDSWSAVSSQSAPYGTAPSYAVWTGSRMIVWAGDNYSYRAGRYDPVADAWSSVTTTGAPSSRSGHNLIWTGSTMLVWGGQTSAGLTNTGGRYDPVADSWQPIATAGAPSARQNAAAVWTGTTMLVWGGLTGTSAYAGDGAAYDPSGDSWSALPAGGAPTPRAYASAVWTGQDMIVWGGYDGIYLGSGSRYRPSATAWTALPSTGAPVPRYHHTAVWTGSEMVVWGGYNGGNLNTGGRYAPATDAWSPTTLVDAPEARSQHAAVWTGSLMLVWGGRATTGGDYALGHDIDDDGDGYSECQGDCDDANPSAWFAPSEVAGLQFAADDATLSWDPATYGGTSPPTYTVYRSPRPDLFVESACVAAGIPETVAPDAEIPGTGETFFYLVGAVNGCAPPGDLGPGAGGVSRKGSCAP